jgi:hypothetical protein
LSLLKLSFSGGFCTAFPLKSREKGTTPLMATMLSFWPGISTPPPSRVISPVIAVCFPLIRNVPSMATFPAAVASCNERGRILANASKSAVRDTLGSARAISPSLSGKAAWVILPRSEIAGSLPTVILPSLSRRLPSTHSPSSLSPPSVRRFLPFLPVRARSLPVMAMRQAGPFLVL